MKKLAILCTLITSVYTSTCYSMDLKNPTFNRIQNEFWNFGEASLKSDRVFDYFNKAADSSFVSQEISLLDYEEVYIPAVIGEILE